MHECSQFRACRLTPTVPRLVVDRDHAKGIDDSPSCGRIPPPASSRGRARGAEEVSRDRNDTLITATLGPKTRSYRRAPFCDLCEATTLPSRDVCHHGNGQSSRKAELVAFSDFIFSIASRRDNARSEQTLEQS